MFLVFTLQYFSVFEIISLNRIASLDGSKGGGYSSSNH